MKRVANTIALCGSTILLIAVLGTALSSYFRTSSLRFSTGSGELQCLVEKGLFQVDMVWGDTDDRGFEWDAHHRGVAWGHEELNEFKPETGIRGVFADFGFATWSYDRWMNFFGPSLPARVFFVPIWPIILLLFCIEAWLCYSVVSVNAVVQSRDRR